LFKRNGSPLRSGFYALYKSLENTEKIRILIGISTSKQTFDIMQKAQSPVQGAFEFSHAETRREKNRLFEELFWSNKYDFVYPVNPYHLHTRLSVQQGVFLCPGNTSKHLIKTLTDLSKCARPTSVLKFVWRNRNKDKRLKALDQLNRMNISRASLFPGLDGFAQSLNHRLRHYMATYVT
jgi:hypothetical protein